MSDPDPIARLNAAPLQHRLPTASPAREDKAARPSSHARPTVSPAWQTVVQPEACQRAVGAFIGGRFMGFGRFAALHGFRGARNGCRSLPPPLPVGARREVRQPPPSAHEFLARPAGPVMDGERHALVPADAVVVVDIQKVPAWSPSQSTGIRLALDSVTTQKTAAPHDRQVDACTVLTWSLHGFREILGVPWVPLSACRRQPARPAWPCHPEHPAGRCSPIPAAIVHPPLRSVRVVLASGPPI